MITMTELLCGVKWDDVPEEHQKNLVVTLERMNRVRFLYGKPMIPTNSYRTMKHHLEIYAKKGITDQSKIPMKSKHLFGVAVDIFDPKKELQAWCLSHVPEIEQIDLWMEDFSATPNWCHFQTVAFGSYKPGGNRWFRPF